MKHLQSGATLQDGKYRIESILGEGGFGNTYIAINTDFDERVAIKEFFMKNMSERDDVTSTVTVSNVTNYNSFIEQKEKFKIEAKRLRKLNNSHIVKVHDMFEENGTVYYVMDYIDGETLSDRLKRTNTPLTEEEVRKILPQLLDALKAVHDSKQWHLDLKPANIMMDKNGNVKLIDFGASKQMNVKTGGATTSTPVSYTNGYAPREQMEQNYEKFGPWTDIYALGATLYNLLTNRRPPLPSDIDDDNSEDKMESLPFPAGISEEMQCLIRCLMQTNRMNRPQRIEDVMALIKIKPQQNNVYDKETDDTVLTSRNEKKNKVVEDGDETILTSKKNVDLEDETILTSRVKPEKREEKTVKESIQTDDRTYLEKNNSNIENNNDSSDNKPKKGNKILIIIIVILISVIGVLLTMFFVNKSSNDKKTEVDTVKVDTVKKDTIAKELPIETKKIKEEVIKKKPTETKPKPVNPKYGTVKLSYGTYTGELENGMPHGHGTVKFNTTRRIVSSQDYVAHPGDRYEGDFRNGVISGGVGYWYHDGEVTGIRP